MVVDLVMTCEHFVGKQTGGHNYTARLNSTFSPTFTGEFAFGLHYQRANTLPESDTNIELLANSFAVIEVGVRVAPTSTNVTVLTNPYTTGFGDFVNGTGGILARNFIDGPGFGLFSTQIEIVGKSRRASRTSGARTRSNMVLNSTGIFTRSTPYRPALRAPIIPVASLLTVRVSPITLVYATSLV